MPSVVRLGDVCTGHCFPSRPNIEGSTNVRVNGLPAHRQGDAWQTHRCDDSSHAGVLAGGSATVRVNGRPIGRVGDAVSCGSSALTGSSNVFVGK